MKLSPNSFVIILFVGLSSTNCKDKSNESNLSFVTEIKTIAHDSSSLKKSESFEKYLIVGEGNQTIYELTVKEDVEGAMDVVHWRKTFFYVNDEFQKDRIYYLQNEDELTTYSFTGGAWIGIEKLYGINGAFEVKSISDMSLEINVLGAWEADLLKEETNEKVTIISDTILTFKSR